MSQCLHCTPGQAPSGPGAFHAADCPQYRSPYVGQDADFWDKDLREWLDLRRNPETEESITREEETLP